jgi:hypothetical protein
VVDSLLSNFSFFGEANEKGGGTPLLVGILMDLSPQPETALGGGLDKSKIDKIVPPKGGPSLEPEKFAVAVERRDEGTVGLGLSARRKGVPPQHHEASRRALRHRVNDR